MKDGESTVLKRGDHSTHGICTTTTRSGNQGHTHAPTLRRDGESHTRTSRFSLRGPFKTGSRSPAARSVRKCRGDQLIYISLYHLKVIHLITCLVPTVCATTPPGNGWAGATAAAQRRRGWRRGGRGRRRDRAHGDRGGTSGDED
jgi:hypothetical protein